MATTYVVLRQDGPTHWEEVGDVEASSAPTAIRYLTPKDDESATFVAVPARSWQPQESDVETIRRNRLKPVKRVPRAVTQPDS